ncbi:putative Epimerase family protein YfcH [Tenacibaculum sp. 190524A02b]|uniref:Epimerase family protein YfcH n=1 Tax=Tenacibaculum vairaonense TaxID=3137860 RepID=A0ABP1FE67_9FLAO
MAKILITGGTGLVGKRLQKLLKQLNHQIVILSRNPKKGNEFKWNITEHYIDEKAFEGITHIIHLAGAGIADKRWTAKRKKELMDSRVVSANLLFSYIKKLQVPLQGFIAASGISYYGAVTTEKTFIENDPSGNDFISEICINWEEASNQFKTLSIPVTILRIGIVLSAQNGALSKMNTPLFLSVLGSGKQYMPWIHIDDLCQLFILAIENKQFTGTYNAVAPEHQTNTSFTKTLGKVIKKIVAPISVPSFVLKLILGELACILLYGSKISATKTQQHYTFKHTKLSNALEDLLVR